MLNRYIFLEIIYSYLKKKKKKKKKKSCIHYIIFQKLFNNFYLYLFYYNNFNALDIANLSVNLILVIWKIHILVMLHLLINIYKMKN